MMQTDVKAAEVSASGSVVAGPARIKALTISYAGSGTIELRDGGAAGPVRWSFTAPAAAGVHHILLPGEGILCRTSIYAALTGCTATVVYG